MKTRFGGIIAAGAFLATLGTAQAGKVLWTAPADASFPGNQTIYCDAVNVGTTPQQVTFEILDNTGSVVGGPSSIVLPPEQGNALGSFGGGTRCRFTVSGSTKKVRAVAVYDNGSGYTLAVPAN